MRKLLLAVAILVSLQFTALAQTQPAKQTPAKTKSVSAKSTTTTSVGKKPAAAATTTTTKTSTNGVVLKKDGTPDKRYKNSAPSGPTKKDGTPDMRYKANKKGK